MCWRLFYGTAKDSRELRIVLQSKMLCNFTFMLLLYYALCYSDNGGSGFFLNAFSVAAAENVGFKFSYKQAVLLDFGTAREFDDGEDFSTHSKF